jgi:hypothetical protein
VRAVARGDAREDRRREPAVLGQLAGRRPALRALRLPGVAELANAGQLLGRVDGADIGVLVERIAEAQRGHALLQLGDDLLDHGLLDEEP